MIVAVGSSFKSKFAGLTAEFIPRAQVVHVLHELLLVSGAEATTGAPTTEELSTEF